MQENRARYLTERGQNVNGQPNVIYLSTDNAATWLPLHEFVDKDNNLAYCEEEVMFFEHQLDLFGKLSYVSQGVGVSGVGEGEGPTARRRSCSSSTSLISSASFPM